LGGVQQPQNNPNTDISENLGQNPVEFRWQVTVIPAL
jgi:hypothetical protein